jgi:hypothetical protein
VSGRRVRGACACGATYDEFRTGQTFKSVRAMMRDDPHPVHGGWRQKRRRCVLGYWHELKRGMWELMHGYCEEAIAARDDRTAT